jgi:hypothetical protein
MVDKRRTDIMSNETKQTAVEWFVENENYLYSQLVSLKINIIEYEKKYKQSVQQAKEMEKKQIEDAELRSKEIIIIKHTEHEGGNK